MLAVARFPPQSDAAEEQLVVSCLQYGEIDHGGAPRGTAKKHGLIGLGSERPYFEPERCDGLVVKWQTIPFFRK